MVRRYPLKSEFKTCFTKVDVPKELLAGVNVIQVNSVRYTNINNFFA